MNDQTTDEAQQSLAAQMQQLQMAGRDTTTCGHGIGETIDDICAQFVIALKETFCAVLRDGGSSFDDCLVGAVSATATLDEFAEVLNDSAKMELAKSYFLFSGAEDILEGNNSSARICAVLARFIEQRTAVALNQTQFLLNWPKIYEASTADEHTLVKFFRRRLPCSCLDLKYEEVKSITKMGICYNTECNIPDRITERSKTMYCSRCRGATYCSRECQKAHWATHKTCCDSTIAKKAEFDAKKQQDDTP